MNISKTHEKFSKYLKNSKSLTNPEVFLGPNTQDVLDFWLVLDELTEDQWIVIKERYTNEVLRECREPLKKLPLTFAYSCYHSTLYKHIYYVKDISVEKITTAIMQSCPGPGTTGVTFEIIGKIKNSVFIPMFLNL